MRILLSLVCFVLLYASLVQGAKSVRGGRIDIQDKKGTRKADTKPKTYTVPWDGKDYALPLGYTPAGTIRPPGTLLLNMLIKNEAKHLDRTLPQWAKIIDFWIIGVDDANTDESPQIIKKHLGHIPGEIVIVHFDGMGPTWSILVEHGIRHYPKATHGILADADFKPMVDRLDKYQLDIRCSKHMYTIWTQDHRNERRMDWIYRNVPGAVVKRQTHQILEVPEFKDQEVFQTLVDLPIEERDEGYQDRTPGKNQRYIGFLERDLRDYPGDTRTLYYLGYAHYDIYNRNREKATEEDWAQLAKGVKYFEMRTQIQEGNEEELWFTMLKLGEIFERFYNDWPTAEKHYANCSDADPDRADSFFYIGQHYRLVNQIPTALPYLLKAATLPIPDRALFNWHYLYQCLSKLEYGRAISVAVDTMSMEEITAAREVLKKAECEGGDPGNVGELKGIVEILDMKLLRSSESKRSTVKKLLSYITKHIDMLETVLTPLIASSDLTITPSGSSSSSLAETVFDTLLVHVSTLQRFYAATPKGADPSCRDYRIATSPLLRFLDSNEKAINKSITSRKVREQLFKRVARVHAVCR